MMNSAKNVFRMENSVWGGARLQDEQDKNNCCEVCFMENRQLLPFERNRYYVGKLLTSADFQAEQAYFNNKRRFLNQLMFGAGIVCGLSVYSLDDLSIMVESGAAIDGLGREVVVESSVVRKLSAIEGFDSLTSERAALCLRYREEAVHPVCTVNRMERDEEYELNRLREGWELFLMDAQDVAQEGAQESEFLLHSTLYEDNDFSVTVTIPAIVSAGSAVKALVRIRKLSEAKKRFTLDCVLQAPAFLAPGGGHEVRIRAVDLDLEKDEVFDCPNWLTAQQPLDEAILLAKTDAVRISIDDEEKAARDSFLLKVAVSAEPVEEILSREVGRVSLEMRSFSAPPEYIRLADISLQLTKSAYIIDRVEECGVKKYLYTTSGEETRRGYESWFASPEATVSAAPAAQPGGAGMSGGLSFQEPLYATGTCEIPLGDRARRGEVFYSSEIMHGLGAGNVYVQVGFEYLAEDSRLSSTAKNTIYGDVSLFDQENLPVAPAQTAVKVMNDRGSFVVAAKLQKETSYVMLLLRWVAVKMPSEDDRTLLQRISDKSISAVQPTVLLGTRESCYFSVRFRNMEPCGLTYELTDRDSGEITPDGVYTAPAREGVYEIRISCADAPLICTYAYAIVKKKENREGEKS